MAKIESKFLLLDYNNSKSLFGDKISISYNVNTNIKSYIDNGLSVKANTSHTHNASDITSGTFAVYRGGTGLNTLTKIGNMIYASSTTAFSLITSNHTTTRQFLRQTGNGTTATAPVWSTLLKADITDFAHTHAISDIANLQTTLNEKANLTGGNTYDGTQEIVNGSLLLDGSVIADGAITAEGNITSGGTVSAVNLEGDGSGVTDLDADNISAGTLAEACLPNNINATRIANGTVDNTEFQYLNGVTSAIQGQINDKANLTGGNTFSGNQTFDSGSIDVASGNLGVSGSISADQNITAEGTVTADNFVGSGELLSDLDAGNISAGTLPIARGGTGLTTIGSSNQLLGVNSAGTALEYKANTLHTQNTDTGTNSDSFAITGGTPTSLILGGSSDNIAFTFMGTSNLQLASSEGPGMSMLTAGYFIGNGSNLTNLSPVNLSSAVPINKGGTALTSLGASNQLLGVNSAGTALEYKVNTLHTQNTDTGTNNHSFHISGHIGGITQLILGDSPQVQLNYSVLDDEIVVTKWLRAGVGFIGFGGGITNLNADNISSGTIAETCLPTNINATKIANGTVDNTEFQYLNGVTSSIQTQLNNKQASHAQLTALSSYASNGLMARTTTNSFAARTITGGTGISVTNGNGISGNPTVAINTSVVPQLGAANSWNNTNTFNAEAMLFGGLRVPVAEVSHAQSPYNLTNNDYMVWAHPAGGNGIVDIILPSDGQYGVIQGKMLIIQLISSNYAVNIISPNTVPLRIDNTYSSGGTFTMPAQNGATLFLIKAYHEWRGWTIT